MGKFFISFLCFLLSTSLFADQSKSSPDCDYWKNGKPRECRKYDSQGNRIALGYFRTDGTLEKKERFNEDGQKIQESYYDENGHLTNNPVDNWAAMRWQYDLGRLVAETFYNDQGRPTQRNIYDGAGNLMDKQFFGKERLLPSEEFNPLLSFGEESEEFFDQEGAFEGGSTVIRE